MLRLVMVGGFIIVFALLLVARPAWVLAEHGPGFQCADGTVARDHPPAGPCGEHGGVAVGGYIPVVTGGCFAFPNQAAAQTALLANPDDPLHLDSDRDGLACEKRGCPCNFERAPLPLSHPLEVLLRLEDTGTPAQAP